MSPRIRVLRILSRLNVGGPSIQVIQLTAGLDPSRFESMLVVGRESIREGNMFDLAESCGVKPMQLHSLGREISLWNDLLATYLLWRLMKRCQPHVVHTHTSKAGFSGRIAARIAGVPVVVHTFHGHVFHGYFGPLATRFFVQLERFLARLSDRVVAISETLRDDLIEREVAPREKIEVIPLGLDLAPFLAIDGRSGELRTALKMSPRDFVIGIVGRLVPVKDHNTFLRAAAKVAAKRSDARFVIVGDGELRAKLEEQASALGLQGLAHFTGWRRDLMSIYADLDLIVLSSRNEGTPVSIIEGSAAGKPVVATKVGGIPDLIEDGWNGLLVPPQDPDALADSMLKILDNPDLAQTFASRSKERVREKYDIARLRTELQMLYIRLLGAKGISVQGIGSPADAMTV
jgi:glycosyltransferase involved in cell wall biosynthesis